MAGLQIDPTSLAHSAPKQMSFGRPQGARANSGIAGAFGLSASLASAFGASADSMTPAPRVPPSSPTKFDAIASAFGASASPLYQQAVAPAPPTSPRLADQGLAPPTSPLHSYGFDATSCAAIVHQPADLEDSDMRLRRGVPSSYEVEPDRIVVTSLDDTSSSEGDGSSEAEGQKTPDADTSTESKESSSDFVINNELMEKLEAHSRAVLTGTSDRDNAASNSRSSGGTARSRRSGRRSAGTAVPSLGSLLSSRRRSAQSSPGFFGYASPINAEDARGALILWKDPEEVLKSTSAAASSSPLKPSDLATVPEGGPAPSSFMSQPLSRFSLGRASQRRRATGPAPSAQRHPPFLAWPLCHRRRTRSKVLSTHSSRPCRAPTFPNLRLWKPDRRSTARTHWEQLLHTHRWLRALITTTQHSATTSPQHLRCFIRRRLAVPSSLRKTMGITTARSRTHLRWHSRTTRQRTRRISIPTPPAHSRSICLDASGPPKRWISTVDVL